MKKAILTLCMLVLCITLTSCKKEEFTFSNNEIVMLSTTPVGGVETYEMYTINIKIYADGRVMVYADNFNRWLGKDEIPVEEFTLSPAIVENIKRKLLEENIPYLRENVGNKDNIEGTRRTITVYGTNGEHTVGGISPSNREFIRAYDYVYECVRENVFIYSSQIADIQKEGYIAFQNRNVKITDELDDIILSDEYINNVFFEEMPAKEEDNNEGNLTTEATEKLYSVVLEFNTEATEYLNKLTAECDEEAINLKLHINDTYETTVMIDYNITDGKIYFNNYTLENAEDLANRITESIK